MPRKRGDEGTFTHEEQKRVVDYVCEQLVTRKRSLFNILDQDKPKGFALCSYATFKRWQRESETIASLVAHAREDMLEAMVEEIVEISDQRNGDVYIDYDKDGNPVAKIDGDAIQRAKLRVYAREKAAAMMLPYRYGQKLDVTSGGEKLASSDAPARLDKIEALLTLAASRARQHTLEGPTIDITPEPTIDDVMS